MNRIDYINRITTNIARFVVEVEGFNAANQYHINIHAESFLIPVLNEVFDLELENLNSTEKRNFPTIDLADFKNRVAFQITATSTNEKIENTVKAFFEKGMDKNFDVLYIYILTKKQTKYSLTKVKDVIPLTFAFNYKNHILDKDDLLQKINAISATPRLVALARIFEHEFSDVQIGMRKQKFKNGYLNTDTEDIFPNLLEIEFPDSFFIADLNIDEDDLTAKINEYLQLKGKKTVKKIKKRKLVNKALRDSNVKGKDWILYENRIFSFRDLHNLNEGLRKVIDVGTIENISCKSYYEGGDNEMRTFKYLLRNTLMEFCFVKEIEWFHDREIFRFANSRIMPNKKQIKWKGKKEATKTVIFEMINKKEGHIICYRNLAFKSSFALYDDKWFVIVSPTWSFTNPYGYKTSRFEPAYMSGIKRLENNNSVFNYFRFFGYYFSYIDLFTSSYPYLKFHQPFALSISPRLDEKHWVPAKIAEKTLSVSSSDIDIDNELDPTLF